MINNTYSKSVNYYYNYTYQLHNLNVLKNKFQGQVFNRALLTSKTGELTIACYFMREKMRKFSEKT